MAGRDKTSPAVIELLEEPVVPSQSLFDGLLKLWRKTRWPSLGELVSAMGIALESQEASSLRSVNNEERVDTKAFEKRWKRAESSFAAIDRGALLDTLLTGNVHVVRDRLKRIAKWPADPRVVPVLLDLTKTVPWTGTASRATWTHVFKLLSKVADPRTLELVSSFDADVIPAERASAREFHLEKLEELGEAVASTLASSKAQPPTQEALDRIKVALSPLASKKPRAKTIDTVASIKDFRDYGDRDALLVLADKLQEQNDPRGELIALQCSAEVTKPTSDQKARIKKLLKDTRILGPLAPIVQKTSLVVERGFVRRCKLKETPSPRELEAARAYPPLRAISEIEGRLEHITELAPRLLGLRRLAITNPSSPLDGVEIGSAGDALAAVEVLACNVRGDRAGELSAFASPLLRLVELRLNGEERDFSEALTTCLKEPWSSRLRCLEVLAGKSALPAYASILELVKETNLLEVRLRGRRLNEPLFLEASKRVPYCVAALRPSANEPFCDISITYTETVTLQPARNRSDADGLMSVLTALTALKPKRLRLRGKNKRFRDETIVQQLRDAALAACKDAVVEL